MHPLPEHENHHKNKTQGKLLQSSSNIAVATIPIYLLYDLDQTSHFLV